MNRRKLESAALAVALFVAGTAMAHHSISMFDHEHPVDLVGTVQEFRFTSPHTFIVLEVKDNDAVPVIWSLEGGSPNSLAWDGWSRKTLKLGDELRITIEPLRSGAPGGIWNPGKVRFKDGSPIIVTH